mgnify:CR=1 FL=1
MKSVVNKYIPSQGIVQYLDKVVPVHAKSGHPHRVTAFSRFSEEKLGDVVSDDQDGPISEDGVSAMEANIVRHQVIVVILVEPQSKLGKSLQVDVLE